MYFCSKEQISKQNKAEHCKQNGYQIVTQKSTNRTEYSYIKGGVTFLSKVSEKYCNKCGFMFLFCNVKHVLSIRCTDGGWGRTVERTSLFNPRWRHSSHFGNEGNVAHHVVIFYQFSVLKRHLQIDNLEKNDRQTGCK